MKSTSGPLLALSLLSIACSPAAPTAEPLRATAEAVAAPPPTAEKDKGQVSVTAMTFAPPDAAP